MLVGNYIDFHPVTIICKKKDFIDSQFLIIIPYYFFLLFDIGIRLVEQVHEVVSGYISVKSQFESGLRIICGGMLVRSCTHMHMVNLGCLFLKSIC
jgi:hypothetical protein